MQNNLWIWIRRKYHRIINSIAFYPGFIALLFLVLAVIAISFDFSDKGQQFKSQLNWLRLKDAATARSILAAIAGGIISLTVFSFSMVMIVLNRAASQMSNRVLDKLIGNRFQQVVLGIYIGTIVYALVLLTMIRDIDSGIYIPAISIYILILITVFDIFLFIYFLHYITQSVKYEVIIDRIFQDTYHSMENSCRLQQEPETNGDPGTQYNITAEKAGIYEGLDKKALVAICGENDCVIRVLQTPGTFVLKDLPYIQSSKRLPENVTKKIRLAVYLHDSESILENFFYGFRQLTEVAVKALSPGINDPGTAVQSLRALFKLFSYRICYFPDHLVKDDNGELRIITQEISFDSIFDKSIQPIWDYGKNDRIIRHELQHLLKLLLSIAPNNQVEAFLQKVQTTIRSKE